MDEIVIEWQLDDAVKERELQDIPLDEYSDLSSYKNTLLPYIVEDFRATLQQALEKKYDYRETIKLSHVRGDVFSVPTDHPNQAKLKNSCGCLLVMLKNHQSSRTFFPTIREYLRYQEAMGAIYSFAIVKSFYENLVCRTSDIFLSQIRDSKNVDSAGLPIFDLDLLLIDVVYLPCERSYKNLQYLKKDTPETSILGDVCFSTSLFRRNVERRVFEVPEYESTIGEIEKLCNDSQKQAIESVLNPQSSIDSASASIQIIHGPPGTGKSFTLVQIMNELFCQKRMVLCTAPTNKAIAELARKFYDNFQRFYKNANISKIVLVGRIERLEVSEFEPIKDLHAEMRAYRLIQATNDFFTASSTTKNFRQECLNFLRNADVQFEFMEVPADVMKNLSVFPEFLKSKVHKLQELLLPSLNTLYRESPYISNLNRPVVKNFMKEMKAILMSIAEEPNENIFKLINHFHHNCISSDLPDFLEQCLGEFLELLTAAVRTIQLNCPVTLTGSDASKDTSKLESDIRENASFVMCTVTKAGAFYGMDFEVCIIDEASQLVDAYTANILNFRSLETLILAGDHRQLPCTVISEKAKRMGYDRSLFERLITNHYPSSVLNVQYRMRPEIIEWPNYKFYNNQIQNGENVTDKNYIRTEWSSQFNNVCIINSAEGTEELELDGTSYFNTYEADLVKFIVKRLRKLISEAAAKEDSPEQPTSIGILSPYAAQVDKLSALSSQRQSDDGSHKKSSMISISVSSVDGCQGQEFDIVIFSAVRSNKIGFVSDERRLNVAITRARYTLIIIGNVKALSNCPVWNDLLTKTKSDLHATSAIRNQFNKKKASLRDIVKPNSTVFQSCVWKVLWTNEFFVAVQKDSSVCRDTVVGVLLRLANGEWNWRINTMVHCRYEPIIRAAIIEDELKIVWSVDVDGIGSTAPTQVLKIWGISVKEKDYRKIIERVENCLKIYSDEYLDRCKFGSDLKTPTPARWSHDSSFKWIKVENIESAQASADVSSSMSSKVFEFNSMNTSLLFKSFKQNIELPFVMSDEEKGIINSEKSAFVVGRSGTGKTTVMLYRLLMKNTSHPKKSLLCDESTGNDDGLENLSCFKQILITASPVLCTAIKASYENMADTVRSYEIGDANLSTPASPAQQPSYEFDVKTSKFPDLPNHFFPMFSTYKDLIRVVDNSLSSPFWKKFASFSENSKLGDSMRGQEIDYNKFTNNFYKHCSNELKRQVSSEVIFTEIMSCIKGSRASLTKPKGFLSRDEYCDISTSRNSEWNLTTRGLIYDEFEKYENRKEDSKCYDSCDAVFYIFKSLRDEGCGGLDIFEEVYVDEVQDLYPSQIVLLKFICRNRNGFVFAGDTVQTITNGVSFRFETLRDIFYYDYLDEYERDRFIPPLVSLTQNFRTHNGILFCARSVVDIISYFFKNSIDNLERESSLVSGPKPIFIDVDDGKDLIHELFSASTIRNFGAEQAILVRDEETKRRVMTSSRKNALVLTVQEAKGMEFDDCLILDFFESSPCRNEWRIIYGMLKAMFDSGKILSTTSFSQNYLHVLDERFPAFDALKHGISKNELKMLYVLITRAKNRLLFSERNSAVVGPILNYWLIQNLIERKHLNEDIMSLFTQSSSEEWTAKGLIFFEKTQFENAEICFSRAGNHFYEKWSHAAKLEQEGDKQNDAGSKKLFVESADILIKLLDEIEIIKTIKHNFVEDIIRCLVQAAEYLRAAPWYEEIGNWDRAGECYSSVGKFEEASNCFWKIGSIAKALKSSYEIHAYRQAVQELTRCKGKNLLSDPEIDKLIFACATKGALHAIDRYSLPVGRRVNTVDLSDIHRVASACESEVMFFVRNYFPTVSEQRFFLTHHQFLNSVLKLDIDTCAFDKVARTYELMPRYKEAAEYYEKAGMHNNSILCALTDVRHMCLNARPQDYTFLPIAMSKDIKSRLQTMIGKIDSLPPTSQTNALSILGKEARLLTFGSELFAERSSNNAQSKSKKSKKGQSKPAPENSKPENSFLELKELLDDLCSAQSSSSIIQNVRLQLMIEQFNFKLLMSNTMRASNTESCSIEIDDSDIDDSAIKCCTRMYNLVTKIDACYEKCLDGAELLAFDRQILTGCFEYFAATPKRVGSYFLHDYLKLPTVRAVRELFGPFDLRLEICEITVGNFLTKTKPILKKIIGDMVDQYVQASQLSLTAFPVPSVNLYNQRLIHAGSASNPLVFYTQQRLKLLVIFHKLISLAKLTSTRSRISSLPRQSDIAEQIFSIMNPQFLFLEDVRIITSQRIHADITSILKTFWKETVGYKGTRGYRKISDSLVREPSGSGKISDSLVREPSNPLVKEPSTPLVREPSDPLVREITGSREPNGSRQWSYSFDRIARNFIAAELADTVNEVGQKINAFCNVEFYRRNPFTANFVECSRGMLITAFMWTVVPNSDVPNWPNCPFLFFLTEGCKSLRNEYEMGSSWTRFILENEGAKEFRMDEILSPFSFLNLFENFTCWALLELKCFRVGVLLPEDMALNSLLKSNGIYVKALKDGIARGESKIRNDVAHKCINLLWKVAFSILQKYHDDHYSVWFADSSKEMIGPFIVRLIVLLRTISMNTGYFYQRKSLRELLEQKFSLSPNRMSKMPKSLQLYSSALKTNLLFQSSADIAKNLNAFNAAMENMGEHFVCFCAGSVQRLPRDSKKVALKISVIQVSGSTITIESCDENTKSFTALNPEVKLAVDAEADESKEVLAEDSELEASSSFVTPSVVAIENIVEKITRLINHPKNFILRLNLLNRLRAARNRLSVPAELFNSLAKTIERDILKQTNNAKGTLQLPCLRVYLDICSDLYDLREARTATDKYVDDLNDKLKNKITRKESLQIQEKLNRVAFHHTGLVELDIKSDTLLYDIPTADEAIFTAGIATLRKEISFTLTEFHADLELRNDMSAFINLVHK